MSFVVIRTKSLIAMPHRLIFYLAILIYAISAICNEGFYHPDEHYQLIEFSEFKSGNNKPADLAWEFNEKIRPGLQPFIFYLLTNLLDMLSLTNPYTVMLVVRLITAFIALFVIRAFIEATSMYVNPKLSLAYTIASYFLWYIPFLSVRFSSENYAVLTFILGLVIFLRCKGNRMYFSLGMLLGLSFLFRFQMAFMSLGLIGWLVFVKKIRPYNLVLVFLGGLGVVNIGVLIDYWLYGTFTYTFLNYFTANILKDVASTFGVSPWHFYLTEFLSVGIYPISLIIVFSFLILIKTDSKNILVWVLVPFLLIHTIVPHKELRFLFPVAPFVPLILILSLQNYIAGKTLSKFRLFLAKCALFVILIINTTALLIAMVSPADQEGRIRITKYISENFTGPVILWHFKSLNLYKPINASQQFYYNKNVHEIDFEAYKQGSDRFIKGKTNLLIVNKRTKSTDSYLFEILNLKLLESGIPPWVSELKKKFRYGDSGESFELYLIENK